jgi:pyruvate dehydrogenase E2 component (dihydrolipoamide acetyltransferase)
MFKVQDEGILAKVLVEAQGQELACGQPIALVVEDQSAYDQFLLIKDSDLKSLNTAAPSEPKESIRTEGVLPATATASAQTLAAKSDIKLSPAARHLVESKSIDIGNVKGTSKGGIINKGDVLIAMKSGVAVAAKKITEVPVTQAPPSPTSSSTAKSSSTPLPTPSISYTYEYSKDPVNDNYKDIPNSNMRKVIAKRLTESKATVPHYYTSIECCIDSLLGFRKNMKKELDINISVNDLVIKSAALALRDYPGVNSKYNKTKNIIEPSSGIDISVAVATPNGLITPIVTNADKIGVSEINSKVKDLATRARDGKLKPEEYQGGSFSISNLGSLTCIELCEWS